MKTTREKILEAGLKLFSQKGFLGATTKEIARAAGVAEPTLFRHFSTKEQLFEEMIKTYSFLPALRGLLPELRDMGPGDALDLIARRYLERLTERRELIRIMLSEIHLYPAKVREIYHAFIDEIVSTLAAYFRDLQEGGTLRGFDAELGARAFLGMFFSFFNAQEFMMRNELRKVNPDQVIREYVEIFLRGISV